MDHENCYYLIGRRHSCTAAKNCPDFKATAWDVRAKLPLAAQYAFPAVLTHRSGLSLAVLQRLRCSTTGRISMRPFASTLRAMHSRAHHVAQLRYLAAALELKQTSPMIGSPTPEPEIFSENFKVCVCVCCATGKGGKC